MSSDQRTIVALTDAEIEAARQFTFSTNNPYCPVDRKSMWKAALAVTRALALKNGLDVKEPSHAG